MPPDRPPTDRSMQTNMLTQEFTSHDDARLAHDDVVQVRRRRPGMITS
jgi:hypothetical protein